jgi:dipeptidyl aminopeptidase/acylaminoacyl peptidase
MDFQKKEKFPFIDKYSITDFKKTRIYQSKEKDKLEQLISAVDVLKGIYLTRLESKNEYPDFYLRNVKNNTLKQISHNVNPFQVLNGVHKEVIKYSRPDGVELSATLYLPAGYDKSKLEKMPMIMWGIPDRI